MFGLQSNHEENNISKNEKQLKELIQLSNAQEAQFEELYRQHQISKDELIAFLADPKNFDEPTWRAMQQIRSEFNDQLKAKLNQIKDPLKAKKSYSDLKTAQQWIFVR